MQDTTLTTRAQGRAWTPRRAAALLWALCMSMVSAASAQQTPHPAATVIETTMSQLRVALEDIDDAPGDTHSDLVIQKVREIVIPHIDLSLSGRMILGRHWRTSTDAQRSMFVDAYKELLLRIYAVHALDYLHAKVEILSVAPSEQADEFLTVRTRVTRDAQRPAAVDYRMVRRGDEWRVFDAVVNGVSIVTTLRTTMDQEIQQSGIDAVNQRLLEKTSAPPS